MYQFTKAILLTALIVIPITSDNIVSLLQTFEIILIFGVGSLILIVTFMKAVSVSQKPQQSKKLQTNKAK